jgi:outer membrane lipoprotein carrier protein
MRSRIRTILRFPDFVILRFCGSDFARSPDHPITRFFSLLMLFMFLCSIGLLAADSGLQQIADRVDKRYNHLTTMKANFQESYNGAGLARNESGELWLQKPGKMRWQYEQPSQKLFIVDGKTAFFYVPGEHQVRRMSAKKLDDFRSPLRYLLGHTKLQSEFNKLEVAADPPKQSGDAVLQGVPKGMEDRVQRVLLEITPNNEISRILVEELDGSTTEFQFSDIQQNVSVKPDLFHFTPPPGVEVVEGQDGEP